MPTVVIARLDLSKQASRVHPDLAYAAARFLREGVGGVTITSTTAVNAECIEALVHPDDKFWRVDPNGRLRIPWSGQLMLSRMGDVRTTRLWHR
jgi:hypothetical protein